VCFHILFVISKRKVIYYFVFVVNTSGCFMIDSGRHISLMQILESACRKVINLLSN